MYEERELNPYIQIALDSPQAIKSQVESDDIRNTILPYWPKIKDGLLFRGTYHELKAQELIVKLYSRGALKDTFIGEKIIPLRDVVDVSFAKAAMVIHRGGRDADDEDLNEQAQTCEIQGTVSIGSFPRWRQKGEDELVARKERYLCIKINEAQVFGDLNDGGDALVWCQVSWGGLTKKTREFRRPNVNQTLYFKISVPPACRGRSYGA